MLNTPFSPWSSFTPAENDAVSRVLMSNKVNYWTDNECRQFETEFAHWSNTTHAISLTIGTAALDIALSGLGIGPGDEVIVTPRTFIASISSVVMAGATPVFADLDRDSGNIRAATISQVITSATKAIIPVHLAAWPCDMDPTMALADQHSMMVIEDCTQAHGATYKGRSVGSIGAWSFCQDQFITTGDEGGMVTTNDSALWDRMWSMKDHGKSWDAAYNRDHTPGFRWLHESFGTNWRMMEIQGAIGRIQLQGLACWTEARARNAAQVAQALAPYCGPQGATRLPEFRTIAGNNSRHTQYKAYAYIQPAYLKSGWSRDRIVAEIIAQGVPCFQGTCSEVYNEKAFDGMVTRLKNSLPVVKELGETSIMFLLHPTLTQAEIDKTTIAITDVMTKAQA